MSDKQQDRDRPENKNGVPQIKVTPEMIEEGKIALTECVGALEWPALSREATVTAIFYAMATAAERASASPSVEGRSDRASE